MGILIVAIVLMAASFATMIQATIGFYQHPWPAKPASQGISQKVLIKTLRDLQEWGLVRRRDYREIPPRVEYSLTRLGASLAHTIAAFDDWVIRNYNEVAEARRRSA